MRFRGGLPRRRGGPLGRGPGPRGPMAGPLMHQLEQAHRLAEMGRWAEAAPLFAELARQAEARAMPQRAGHLHLQAARCLFQLRETGPALNHARAGLRIFSTAGMPERFQHTLQRTLEGLRANGLTAEADTLAREFGAPVGNNAPPTAAESATPAALAPLPAKCPACGGPLRSDEVEWIDEASAECPFCGGVVQRP